MTEVTIHDLIPANSIDTVTLAVALPDGNTISPPITREGVASFLSLPGVATVTVTATSPFGVKASGEPIAVTVPDAAEAARVPVVPRPSFTFAVPA